MEKEKSSKYLNVLVKVLETGNYDKACLYSNSAFHYPTDIKKVPLIEEDNIHLPERRIDAPCTYKVSSTKTRHIKKLL